MTAARLIVLAAAIGAFAIGIARGTWAVGGSDSSCYALMADAFAQGRLQPFSPLADAAPWPDAARTFAPAGFIPSPVRSGSASPICSPGFALLLAPFRALGGPDGIFVVTPIAGALLVLATFMVGRYLAGPIAGATAALLVGTAPIFLFQLLQPMNDIVVALLWTGVLTLAVRPQPSFAATGVVMGLALLMRPNLAAAAVPVLSWVMYTAGREAAASAVKRLVAGAAPFLAVAALLNHLLYGGPFATGYGSLGDLFSTSHVGVNVEHYGRALLATQLGVPLIAVAAPFVVERDRRPIVALAAGIVLAVAATYLLYRPFPEWWYLRFFLPILPALSALATSALVRVGGGLLAVVVAAVGVAYAVQSSAAGEALDLPRLEGRFRTTAAIVRERLPREAIAITVWESGTVRSHAGREALMWDALDPQSLDSAVEWAAARGLEPFIVIEEREEPLFRERFAAHSALGALDWPPRFTIDRQVRIYAPPDRAAYLAGTSVVTENVWTDRYSPRRR